MKQKHKASWGPGEHCERWLAEFSALLRQWCITAVYQHAGKQSNLRSITTNSCSQAHHHHAAPCRHPHLPHRLHQRPELKIAHPLSSPSHHVRPASSHLLPTPLSMLWCFDRWSHQLWVNMFGICQRKETHTHKSAFKWRVVSSSCYFLGLCGLRKEIVSKHDLHPICGVSASWVWHFDKRRFHRGVCQPFVFVCTPRSKNISSRSLSLTSTVSDSQGGERKRPWRWTAGQWQHLLSVVKNKHFLSPEQWWSILIL